MKFHHGQKIKVINGYYKTYKGIVLSHRIIKDDKVEYNIKLKLPNSISKDSEIKFIIEWIREDNLKVSWF